LFWQLFVELGQFMQLKYFNLAVQLPHMKSFTVFLVLVGLVVFSGCVSNISSIGTTGIQDVYNNPENYSGKTITLEGRASYYIDTNNARGMYRFGFWNLADSQKYTVQILPLIDRQITPSYNLKITGIVKSFPVCACQYKKLFSDGASYGWEDLGQHSVDDCKKYTSSNATGTTLVKSIEARCADGSIKDFYYVQVTEPMIILN